MAACFLATISTAAFASTVPSRRLSLTAQLFFTSLVVAGAHGAIGLSDSGDSRATYHRLRLRLPPPAGRKRRQLVARLDQERVVGAKQTVRRIDDRVRVPGEVRGIGIQVVEVLEIGEILKIMDQGIAVPIVDFGRLSDRAQRDPDESPEQASKMSPVRAFVCLSRLV